MITLGAHGFCSVYSAVSKSAASATELTVFTHLNKPQGVSPKLNFRHMLLHNPDQEKAVESRYLHDFPNTLIGSLNRSFEVYLLNLNWSADAAKQFNTQRAKDVTMVFAKQVIDHFTLPITQEVLETPSRR